TRVMPMPATETQARPPDRKALPSETDFPETRGPGRDPAPGRLLTWGALLIIAAGTAMRLVSLGARPYGICPDEAFYGLEGVCVLHCAHSLDFPFNTGCAQ